MKYFNFIPSFTEIAATSSRKLLVWREHQIRFHTSSVQSRKIFRLSSSISFKNVCFMCFKANDKLTSGSVCAQILLPRPAGEQVNVSVLNLANFSTTAIDVPSADDSLVLKVQYYVSFPDSIKLLW